MVKNHTIQMRVSRQQYELIKANARGRGFTSLSSFVRWASLDRDAFLETKLLEIHRQLIGPPQQVRRSKAARREVPAAYDFNGRQSA